MRILSVVMLSLIVSGNALAQSSRSSSSSSSSDTIPCVADARWLNTTGNLDLSRGSQTPLALSLLAHVGNGTNCSATNISFSATYLNENQEFICSGTIFGAMSMSSQVQAFNIEVRPFSSSDVLRWRNQPGIRGLQAGKKLSCMNLDGTSDLGDTERLKAAWVRISVGVMPAGGGLSVVEAMIRVMP